MIPSVQPSDAVRFKAALNIGRGSLPNHQSAQTIL